MRGLLVSLLVLAAAGVALVWAAEYGWGPVIITREDQYKMVLRFGNPVKTLREPGLSWRVPVLDDVLVFDRRLQYLNAEPVEMPIAGGEKLIIDYFAVWRITDPLAFLQNYPQGVSQAKKRIQETVKAQVGDRMAPLELKELLARGEELSTIDEVSSTQLADTGVSVLDVRLNRIELPRESEPAAYSQMREQRHAVAREHRAVGDREARRIRADADRESQVILAAARSKAEIVRGEGDAESTRIYANAYGRDAEFYAFVRSLEAYRRALDEKTTMVLAPDHPFFRFLAPEEVPPRSRETRGARQSPSPEGIAASP